MKRIIATLSAVILTVGVVLSVVLAASEYIEKTLLYDDIKITLRGEEIKPADVNGNYIEPFIIEGTTYLPVRGIASALGLTVGWDDATKTVKLNEPANNKTVIFNERKINFSFIKYEYTADGDLTVRFQTDNKNMNDITVDIYDTSVNGHIIDCGFKGSFAAGKKEYADVIIEADLLKEKNITYVREIEFTVDIIDEFSGAELLLGSSVIVTPDGVTVSGGEVSDTEESDEVLNSYTGDATYDDFIEFIEKNGETSDDGVYKVTYAFSVMEKPQDRPALYSVSLTHGGEQKDICLSVMANRKAENETPKTIYFDATLSRDSDVYVYEGIFAQSYEVIEGELPANKKMFDPDEWTLNKVIVREAFGSRGKFDTIVENDIMKKYLATAYADLLKAVSEYGDGIFTQYGSDLTFEFFGM